MTNVLIEWLYGVCNVNCIGTERRRKKKQHSTITLMCGKVIKLYKTLGNGRDSCASESRWNFERFADSWEIGGFKTYLMASVATGRLFRTKVFRLIFHLVGKFRHGFHVLWIFEFKELGYFPKMIFFLKSTQLVILSSSSLLCYLAAHAYWAKLNEERNFVLLSMPHFFTSTDKKNQS